MNGADTTSARMVIIMSQSRPGPEPGEDMARRTKDTTVSETVITVVGMTCGHCVSAVQGEIGKLAGVTGVEVDLDTGKVRVTADPVPDRAALRAAVDEAGYELTG